LISQAFSANRQASMNCGFPKRSHTLRTARMFSRLTGCPPPELFVTVSITRGTVSACSTRRRSRAPTSMFPLKGRRRAGCSPSALGRSTAVAPVNSMLARVVSKCVLFGTTTPGPPSTLKRIFSAPRPWWVGRTCLNGKSSCTASLKRVNDGEPA
jgi:AraC-like DNA-binding protein